MKYIFKDTCILGSASCWFGVAAVTLEFWNLDTIHGDALRKWMLVQMESAMHWGLGGSSTMGRPCMLNMIGVDIYMVHLT